MTTPIKVDLPHKLGAAEAKRRIEGGIGRLESFIPGGADVRSAWTGDRLGLQVASMGQEVNVQIDVRETLVHVELLVPAALGFFSGVIEAALRKSGQELLEDKRR